MELIKIQDYEYDRIRRIKKTLGGSFPLMERLKRGGIGSPLAYYREGLPDMDEQRLDDDIEIRLNLEELTEGFFIRLNDQRTTYLVAVPYQEMKSIELFRVSGNGQRHAVDVSLKPVADPSTDHLELRLAFANSVLTAWTQPNNLKSWVKYLKGSVLRTFG